MNELERQAQLSSAILRYKAALKEIEEFTNARITSEDVEWILDVTRYLERYIED